MSMKNGNNLSSFGYAGMKTINFRLEYIKIVATRKNRVGSLFRKIAVLGKNSFLLSEYSGNRDALHLST